MSNGNFLTNPFDGLSTNQSLKEMQKILGNPNIGLEELEVRELQLKHTQKKAHLRAENNGLLKDLQNKKIKLEVERTDIE